MNTPWKNKPEKTEALVLRLEQRLKEVQIECETARTSFGAALFEAEEETSKDAIITKEAARKALDVAETRVRETELLLTAAQAKHAASLARDKVDLEAKCWAKLELLAKERVTLAEELQSDVEKLNGKLRALLDLGPKVHALAPRKEHGLSGSLLDVRSVEHTFRLQLSRFGYHWAADWPWSIEAIPSLVQRVSEGNAWILKERLVLVEKVGKENHG